MFKFHPKMAKEWADKTASMKSLPNRVKKSKLFNKLAKLSKKGRKIA